MTSMMGGVRRADGGFTMLELLIVLVILSVMLVMVATRFEGSGSNAQLKNSAMELAALLRDSHSRAIANGRETTVHFDFGASRYHVTGSSLRHAAAPGVTLAPGAATDGALRFFPDGSSSGGAVIVRGRAGAYRVEVSWLTGQVEVSPHGDVVEP